MQFDLARSRLVKNGVWEKSKEILRMSENERYDYVVVLENESTEVFLELESSN